MAGAAVVPGILAERSELNSAGDGLPLAVPDALPVAVDDEGTAARGVTDRTDPDDDVADPPGVVADKHQVAGAQDLDPLGVGVRQLECLDRRRPIESGSPRSPLLGLQPDARAQAKPEA